MSVPCGRTGHFPIHPPSGESTITIHSQRHTHLTCPTFTGIVVYCARYMMYITSNKYTKIKQF